MELVLEQTQQGSSHKVSVSTKGVEELKRMVQYSYCKMVLTKPEDQIMELQPHSSRVKIQDLMLNQQSYIQDERLFYQSLLQSLIWSLDELAYVVPSDGPYQTNPPSFDDIISTIRIDREGQARRIHHEEEIDVQEYQVLTREIEPTLKPLEEIIRENVFCLGSKTLKGIVAREEVIIPLPPPPSINHLHLISMMMMMMMEIIKGPCVQVLLLLFVMCRPMGWDSFAMWDCEQDHMGWLGEVDGTVQVSTAIPIEDSDSFMEEINLSFTPNDPMPLSIEEDDYDSERDILILEELLSNDSLSLPENESFHFDIPSSSYPPANPSDGNLGILNVKVMGDISEHYVPMPRLMLTQPTLIPNQEKSPSLLSHHGHKASQPSTECPMMIYGRNNPILDVPFLHFYLP
nr:hypothetical protein [Tanacetum cinerariifolium]